MLVKKGQHRNTAPNQNQTTPSEEIIPHTTH